MSLNKKGMEVPDNRSLVAVCDLTPLKMSDRINRYIRSPQLRDDLLFSEDDYDPDDFYDDEDRPMSPHEERFEARKARLEKAKYERDQAELKAKEDARRAEDEAFQQRVRDVKDSIKKSSSSPSSPE